MMGVLPQIKPIEVEQLIVGHNSLFICCEGFEERSLSFVSKLDTQLLFSKAYCYYLFARKKVSIAGTPTHSQKAFKIVSTNHSISPL